MAAPAGRTAVDSARAWTSSAVSDASSWAIELAEEQRRDVASAARRLVAEGADPLEAGREAFALPSLRPVVERCRELLSGGHGFALLRGFPVDLLTEAETEAAYLGLGQQLGSPVSQNADGDLIGHVRDERIPRTDPTVRLYRTAERQDFHTDGADIVGLLCLKKAKKGGESKIASSLAIYNELLSTRPDLLEVLYEPMHWDRNGEESPGEAPTFALPVITDIAGVPRFFFISWYIRDAQRHAGVPRLSSAQIEAIEAVEAIANDPRFHVEMAFEPGDVQLLSNAWILHAREAYEDAEDLDERRHLLRLWLSAHDYASVDDLLREGIPAKG